MGKETRSISLLVGYTLSVLVFVDVCVFRRKTVCIKM